MEEMILKGDTLRAYIKFVQHHDKRSWSDHYVSGVHNIFWYEGLIIIRHNEPRNDLTHVAEFKTSANKWNPGSLEKAVFDIKFSELNLVEERIPEFYDEILRNILRYLSNEPGKIDFLDFNPLPDDLVERGFCYNEKGKIETLLLIR